MFRHYRMTEFGIRPEKYLQRGGQRGDYPLIAANNGEDASLPSGDDGVVPQASGPGQPAQRPAFGA